MKANEWKIKREKSMKTETWINKILYNLKGVKEAYV